MTSSEQRDAARVIANEKRMAVARMRRQLRDGDLTLQQVFENPPVELHGYTVADVLRLARGRRRYQASPAMREIGRLAVRDQVNLMVALGDASCRTRAWAAQYGQKWTSRPKEAA